MSTRSNIIIVTPDNNIHQFYHHWDGYLSGVGDELRKYLVYSIGLCTRVKKLSLYDILVEYISSDDDYEYECTMDLNASNKIHADVDDKVQDEFVKVELFTNGLGAINSIEQQ